MCSTKQRRHNKMNPDNYKKINAEDIRLYQKALKTKGINIWKPRQVQQATGLPPEKHNIIQKNYLALKNKYTKTPNKKKINGGKK